MLVARFALILAVVLTLLACFTMAQPSFSEWSAPENLGAVVNSTFNDQAPVVSKNGRSLYFSSNRPGYGAGDIWVSQRESEEEPWGTPATLGPVINTASTEWRPSLSRDEHWLFFSSNRVGGSSGLDIWASHRKHVHDDFGWEPPVNLGPGVNSGNSENNASYFENDDCGAPQLFISSNRPGGPGAFDIFVSKLLPDGTWGLATIVPELSSTLPEIHVSVRFDGLEVFFARGVPPAGFDLWTATRNTVLDPWSEPINLGPLVNSVTVDEGPHIAPDGQTLYFESSRDGFGGRDLWKTTRTKHK